MRRAQPLLLRVNFWSYFFLRREAGKVYSGPVIPQTPDRTAFAAEPPAPGRSFRRFYEETVAPLRRYLARILGSITEAQDVAQDAYVKMHAVMEEKQLERPQAYLYITARRLAIDELRRRRNDPLHRQFGDALEGVLSEAPGIERVVIARQELTQLLGDVEALPPGCRAVFLLGRMENLTHQQIAEKLGLSCSTVEKQHARALRLLRKARVARADESKETTP